MTPEVILHAGGTAYIANTRYNNPDDILRLLPIANENDGTLIINDAGLNQHDLELIVGIARSGNNLLILDDGHLSDSVVRVIKSRGANIAINLSRPDYIPR